MSQESKQFNLFKCSENVSAILRAYEQGKTI